MRIGFFDSGIGGLSVLERALEALPDEKFIYYADVAHVPYGEKTQDEIMAYTDAAVDFLIKLGAEAVVIACNTATSVAVAAMREKYPVTIIGMEPAVKKAVDLYGDRRVLVAATPITVSGSKMKNLIERVDKHHLVDLVPMPALVRFAERGEFVSAAVAEYIGAALKNRNLGEYSSIVLGCTHFNYFKDTFRALLPENVRFVDGIDGTVCQLIRKLGKTAKDGAGRGAGSGVEYYFSGRKITETGELEKIERLLQRLARMRKIL